MLWMVSRPARTVVWPCLVCRCQRMLPHSMPAPCSTVACVFAALPAASSVSPPAADCLRTHRRSTGRALAVFRERTTLTVASLWMQQRTRWWLQAACGTRRRRRWCPGWATRTWRYGTSAHRSGTLTCLVRGVCWQMQIGNGWGAAAAGSWGGVRRRRRGSQGRRQGTAGSLLADAPTAPPRRTPPPAALCRAGECTHLCQPGAYHLWLYQLNRVLREASLGSRVQVQDAQAAAMQQAAGARVQRPAG